MVTVAVAGGTSGLGRAIADVLVAQKENKAIVLSRNADPELEKEIGLPIVPINFTDVQSIAETLERHEVETVISAVNNLTNSAPEISLIRAANLSRTTKRYIPSIWGSYHYGPEQAKMHESVVPKLEIIAEIEKTSLSYTSVYNGYFLDYYGIPRIKTYQRNVSIVIDVANGVAGIPAEGKTPVAFTYTLDVAKFAVALLTLESWPKESWVIGDRIAWSEFLSLAEAARGFKFQVTYDSIENLTKGIVTKLPCQDVIYQWIPEEAGRLCADYGLWSERGVLNLQPEHTLNEQFPEIKALTVKEFLQKAWQGS